MATLKLIADEIAGALNRPFDSQFKERVKSIFRHEAAVVIRQAINKDGLSDHFKSRYTANIAIINDTTLPCGSECGVIRTVNKVVKPIRIKSDEPFSWVGNKSGSVIYLYTGFSELPYADLTEVYYNKPIRYTYQNDYIYIHDGGICGNISSIIDYSNVVNGSILITSKNHNLQTGHKITIISTTGINNNIYTITKVSDDTFYVTKTYVADEATGTWTRVLNDTCISIEAPYLLGDVFDSTPEAALSSTTFTDETELPLAEDLIQAIKLRLLNGELSIIDNKDKTIDSHIDNQ